MKLRNRVTSLEAAKGGGDVRIFTKSTVKPDEYFPFAGVTSYEPPVDIRPVTLAYIEALPGYNIIIEYTDVWKG